MVVVSCGYMYQNTSHSSSLDNVFYYIVYWRGDGGICIYRSQDIRHSSYRNCGARVDADGRGVCMSQTSHYIPITQVDVVDCRVSHIILVLLTKMFMVMI